jgi:hypothetical protein
MTVIDSLFGVSWKELEISHLISFLQVAGDEGLTWEVKGDRKASRWPRREQVEKAVSGFANSQLGGILIIGAERDKKSEPGWSLAGLSPPTEQETEMAISRIIRSGVRPTPPFRVKAWTVAVERKAAVVWVEPVDRPPSITRDGRVFERTTGETEPVKDPAILSQLFAAGERASGEAEDKARRVAFRAMNAAGALTYGTEFDWSQASSQQGRFGLGVAATAYGHDIGGRLFHRSFGDALERIARDQLVCIRAIGFDGRDHFSMRQQRDSIVARLDPSIGLSHARHFALLACWDGAVGVSCLESEGASLDLTRDELLRPAWNVASRLVLLLHGAGALHVAIAGEGPMHDQHRWPRPDAPVQRSVELDGDEDVKRFEVSPGDLDYVMDELYRLGGEDRWVDVDPKTDATL